MESHPPPAIAQRPPSNHATTERSHVITQRQLVERRMTTDPVIAGGLQTTPFALAVLRERSPKSTATTSDTGFKTLVTRGVVGHWPAASRDLRDMRNTCTCLWNAACHHQPRPVGTCTCLWDAASTGNRRGDIRASTENHRATSGPAPKTTGRHPADTRHGCRVSVIKHDAPLLLIGK